MPSSPNVPRLKKMLQGFTMPTVKSTTLTVSGVQTHTNASGAYVNGRNTVIKTATASASDQLRSGAIYVPAGSLIRTITVLVTTVIVRSEAAGLGVRAGDEEDDATYCTLVTTSLASSGAGTVAAGIGTSSDTILNADLSGNYALALGNLHITSTGEIHVEMQPSAGTLTSGAVAFIVELQSSGVGIDILLLLAKRGSFVDCPSDTFGYLITEGNIG